MPPLEEHDLIEDAVLWEAAGRDRYNNPKVSAAQDILVRWTFARREAPDPQSSVYSYDATLAYHERIPDGSIVWEGNIESMVGTGTDEIPESDLYQVIGAEHNADIKSRISRYEHHLQRFSDSLPEVVE